VSILPGTGRGTIRRMVEGSPFKARREMRVPSVNRLQRLPPPLTGEE
jgi:hypothetical protein